MAEMFREGGWGMIPTVLFGLLALGAAFRYAIRTETRLLGFIASLGHAVLFFALSGFTTGVIATVRYVEEHATKGDVSPLTLLTGVRESSNNLAAGFTLLALVHLVVAVGRRRRAALQNVAESEGSAPLVA